MIKLTTLPLLSLSITFLLATPLKALEEGELEVTGNSYLATLEGKVGIGTTEPLSTLEVASPDDWAQLSLHTQNKEKGGRLLFQTEGKTDYQIIADSAQGALSLLSSDKTAFLRHNKEADTLIIGIGKGKVGVGILEPTEKLEVNGTVKCVSLVELSDSRYKKNVQAIEQPLEKVSQLRGVEWEWDADRFPDEEGAGAPQGKQYGVIAREVEQALPGIVNTTPNGDKAVAYTKMIGLLIEAIKEQQTHIAQLEERLIAVEKR